MNKVAIVRIKFYNMNDLILTLDEYEKMGKMKGFLKKYNMSILDIKSINYEVIDVKDFPITEWEP